MPQILEDLVPESKMEANASKGAATSDICDKEKRRTYLNRCFRFQGRQSQTKQSDNRWNTLGYELQCEKNQAQIGKFQIQRNGGLTGEDYVLAVTNGTED
jgi:hypothetical protein